MLDNPFGEEMFPNIQSKPLQLQLEAISFCPIACYLREEASPHQAAASFQGLVESDKDPSSLVFSRSNNLNSPSHAS